MSFNLMSTTVLLPLARLGDLAIHLIVLEHVALPSLLSYDCDCDYDFWRMTMTTAEVGPSSDSELGLPGSSRGYRLD